MPCQAEVCEYQRVSSYSQPGHDPGLEAVSGRNLERPPFRRAADDRWIAGVCSGLATHLGVPVMTVRLVMLALGCLGVGIVLYLFWWATMEGTSSSAQSREGSTRGIVISA